MLAGVKSVVVPKLGEEQSVIRDLVNHSVFFVDSVKSLFIGFLPVQIVFPGVLGEE